jgi:hypothetical protein
MQPAQAQRQTVETPTAPGSNSNFTGLPEDPADIPVVGKVHGKQMQEHIEVVKQNFRLIFKDIMDKDHFESKIYFRDPMTTNLNSFRAYQFICQFLRYFLAPIFELHEVRQAGEQEILVKWSWTMNFWWNRYTPFKLVWDPRLVFTGITILGYNPDTGKWNKHVDAWDAIQDNEFFSVEGFIFAFSQMFQLHKPPNRFTPEFQIYKKYKNWEIRRYRPRLMAEVSLQELESSGEAVGSGPGIVAQAERAQRDKAEVLLERYLGLGNDREEFFELTTPLFISKDETFSLLVPGYGKLDDLPKPHKEHLVKLREEPQQFYACVTLTGSPTREDLEEKARFLRKELEADGCRASGDGWLFARYNKDSWPRGPFRRNDLLIPLEAKSVDLWRGVDWGFVERIVTHKV